MCVSFGVLLLQGERGGLLVTPDTHDVANERKCGAFTLIAIDETAGLEPPQIKYHGCSHPQTTALFVTSVQVSPQLAWRRSMAVECFSRLVRNTPGERSVRGFTDQDRGGIAEEDRGDHEVPHAMAMLAKAQHRRRHGARSRSACRA